jgi:hypothetical protein
VNVGEEDVTMQILVVADKAEDYVYSPGLKERMPDVECVLSCGDLPFYYLEFIVSSLNVPLFYVFGNHNTYEYRHRGESEQQDFDGMVHSMWHTHGQTSQIKWAPEGCTNVDGRVVHYKGLTISGLEGSMRYRPHASHQYTEDQMQFKVALLSLRLIFARLRWGHPLDILITHAPPYRIHDGQDLPHRGFKAFLRLMDRFRPRYLIHGHRHIYHLQRPEVTQYRQTTVINVYGHSLLEMEPLR